MEPKSTNCSNKSDLCRVQKDNKDRTSLCLEGEVSLLPRYRGSLLCGANTSRVQKKEILSLADLDKLAANTGCSEHSDCLTCPLPKCIYDMKGVYRMIERRRTTIREMARSMSGKEIAKQLGISLRTVQRALGGVVNG